MSEGIQALISELRSKKDLTWDQRVHISEVVLEFCSDSFREQESEMRRLGYPDAYEHEIEHEMIQQDMVSQSTVRLIMHSGPRELAELLESAILDHIKEVDSLFHAWKTNISVVASVVSIFLFPEVGLVS